MGSLHANNSVWTRNFRGKISWNKTLLGRSVSIETEYPRSYHGKIPRNFSDNRLEFFHEYVEKFPKNFS
jgi:hypothetical protein